MSEIFTIEDIFNIMIKLETVGSSHYSKMKELTDNYKLKELFDKLSKAEQSHKVIYENLKKEVIVFNHESIDSEYSDYINALLNQTINFLQKITKIKDFDAGYEIAVSLEKDTILFLRELSNIIDSQYIDKINIIIEEEKRHLVELYLIKNNLNNQ